MRSAIANFLKAFLRGLGFQVFRTNRLGHDPLQDIVEISAQYGIPIETIFDVGAHRGGSTSAFRNRFPNAKILCFEPDPVSFELLSGQFAPDQQVNVFRQALADKPGIMPFHIYPNSFINSLNSNAPFAQTYGATAEVIEVEVSTIDIVVQINSIDRINFLKVDTEGFEPQVLQGAIDTLKSQKVDFLFLEFNSIYINERSSPLVEIARIVEPLGYRFVATYNDGCELGEKPFNVSNVLFVRNFASKSK